MAGAELDGLPVSAPGAASTRTDLDATQGATPIPSAFYGDAVETSALQTAAPMYAKPRPKLPTPLFAPSQRPSEPITAGVDVGPGVGSAGLGPPGQQNSAPPAPPLLDTMTLMSSAPAVSPRLAGLLAVVERLGW